MNSSNCFLLTCIQVSQEANKVLWYSLVFENFPQFSVIHRVKGFNIINGAEVDVFLEFPYFLYDPMNVGNLISGSSAFSKSSLTSESSWFAYCWSLAWRILGITLLACEMCDLCNLNILKALPFFGTGMKIDLFQFCGHCWVFQICWRIECSTLTASTLRDKS